MARRILIILFVFIFFLDLFLLFAEGEKKAADSIINSGDIKYQNAVLLYNIKRFDVALREFKEYIEIYLNGNHRKDVYQKIASIYFERFDYIQSIKAYRTLYEEFSSSEEGIGAYYQMGICYRKIGYDKKAIIIFKSIIKDYPNSNYAYLSKIQIDLHDILRLK